MDIVFVGAGRLATNLAQALSENGHRIVAVYSHTMESAQVLARLVGALAVDDVAQLPSEADAFILAVKDSVLPTVAQQLDKGREEQVFFHTAGSVPMSVFGNHHHCGVVYPMQTFSKQRRVDFGEVTFFVEASDSSTLHLAKHLAGSVSNHVKELSSEERRYLHLAAVFACNFVNHCYTLSADVLSSCGLSFDVMLPLVNETARKVATMSPAEAQTGPAVRYDENVIDAQLKMLSSQPLMQQVYRLMSQSIHEHSEN